MTHQPTYLITCRDSIGLPELVTAVNAAQAALDVALAREYAGECALHDAHQAARTAPPEQLRQADAWCAAAGDKLHSAILEVKRAIERLVIAQKLAEPGDRIRARPAWPRHARHPWPH